MERLRSATGLVLAALTMAAVLWGSSSLSAIRGGDIAVFGPVGITRGQMLRLNVSGIGNPNDMPWTFQRESSMPQAMSSWSGASSYVRVSAASSTFDLGRGGTCPKCAPGPSRRDRGLQPATGSARRLGDHARSHGSAHRAHHGVPGRSRHGRAADITVRPGLGKRARGVPHVDGLNAHALRGRRKSMKARRIPLKAQLKAQFRAQCRAMKRGVRLRGIPALVWCRRDCGGGAAAYAGRQGHFGGQGPSGHQAIRRVNRHRLQVREVWRVHVCARPLDVHGQRAPALQSASRRGPADTCALHRPGRTLVIGSTPQL